MRVAPLGRTRRLDRVELDAVAPTTSEWRARHLEGSWMRITIFLTALCVTGSSWAQVEPWPKRGELFATGIIEEIYFEDEIGEPPEEVGQVVHIYLDTRTEAVSFE